MAQGMTGLAVAFVPPVDRAQLVVDPTRNPEAAQARYPKLMAACQSFEAIFLSQLLRVMRQGELKDTLFGGGMAEGMYREMLDDQLAGEMATSGSTGIAAMLYDQLEELMHAQEAAAAANGINRTTPVTEVQRDALVRRMTP